MKWLWAFVTMLFSKSKILRQQEKIMSALENLNSAIGGVVGALGNLRDDVVTLRDEVSIVVTLLKKPGGVSEAEIQAAADKLTVAKDGLAAADADFDKVTGDLKAAADAVNASGGPAA